MTGPGDLGSAAGVAGSVSVVLLAAELWARRGAPNPEGPRKLVHLGGCLPCLFFPFLFKSPWVVGVLAVFLTATFAMGARWKFLKCLHSVGRKTRGSEYYPLAILFLYLMAADRPWLYLSGLLVLGVADAFSALIGSSYGRIRFEVEDEKKSVEGSLVFLVIAFLAIHLPMVLMTDLPRETCVLTALLTAILVTGIESISLHGTDNLFIPVGVYVILDKSIQVPPSETVTQLASLLGWILFLGFLTWRTRSLNVGGAIVFILFAYGAWALGSWVWALPPLLGFLLYITIRTLFPPPAGHRTFVRVVTVTQSHIPLLLILAYANATREYALLQGPYVASYTVMVALAVWTYLLWLKIVPPAYRRVGTLLVGVLAWGVVAIPTWCFLGTSPATLLSTLAVCLPLALAHDLSTGPEGAVDINRLWNAPRFLLTCAAGLAILALQWAEVLPLWRMGS